MRVGTTIIGLSVLFSGGGINLGPAEETGVFTAIEELSDLREIHSAEKHSYLILFPDGEPHSVIHPSFVILDFRSLKDEDNAALEELREWDERLGVKLLELHVFEDAETRFCRIATSHDKVIQEFPPPPGYNPYEYAEAYILYLRSMGIAVTERMERSLYEMLDPARMRLRIRVLDPESAEILADNIASCSLAPPGEGIGLLGDSGRQKFELTEITKEASGVVKLSFGGAGSASRLAVYSQDGPDYCPPALQLVGCPTKTALWLDTTAPESRSRYYTCFNLDRPYLQHVKTDGVTVMWLGDSHHTNGKVEFSSDNWQTFSEKDDEQGSPQEVGDFYVYTVKLESLSEDTLYEYQAFWGTRTSAVHSFRTLKSSPSSFRFVAYGDNRGNSGTDIRREHVEVVGLGILGAGRGTPPPDAQFAIHVGDFIHDDNAGKADQWLPHFFLPASPLIANVPLFPCLGNHEYIGDSDCSNYLALFEVPDNGLAQQYKERWYSFDYGNCHFTILDTWDISHTSWYEEGSVQHNWARTDLDGGGAWNFVFLHCPPYTETEYGEYRHHYNADDVEAVRDELAEKIFNASQYGINFVFSGHNHFYERSFVNYVGSETHGVYYIVTGGAGAPTHTIFHDAQSQENPYRVHAERCHEHCVVDVIAGEQGSRVFVQAVRNDGSVLDFFGTPEIPDLGFILPGGASGWKYDQSGEDLGWLWQETWYDDGEWSSGPAPLGYGDGTFGTTLTNTGEPIYYFRKHFNPGSLSAVEYVSLDVIRDGGCVAYLNGREVFRSNMPRGPLHYDDQAAEEVHGQYDWWWHKCRIDKSLLRENDDNVVAVQVHQDENGLSDVSFDLRIQKFGPQPWRQ